MKNYGIGEFFPKVSVIIPSYNCGQYVTKAIDSVLEQTYKEYEIILVDDGSKDGTKKTVEKYLQFINFNYIYQQNKGLAAARNIGIRNARGKYIALLDADDWWSPTKLEKQIKVFEGDSEIELVHSNVYVAYEENKEKIEPYCMNIDYNKLSKKKLFEKILFWEADICVPTIIIKKTLLDKVGYFDEKLSYLGCEDREFCLRAFRGSKTFFINDYLAYYLQRKNSMTKDLNKMQKAREYLIEKTIKETGYFKNKKKIKKIIYSKLFFREGVNFFRRRNKKEALKKFIQSIKYKNFNLNSYFYILLCLLPNKLIELTNNYRRSYASVCKKHA
jgi:glycosyltransferase involved in cell wall biosynthesis